jgi:hypothetical protein
MRPSIDYQRRAMAVRVEALRRAKAEIKRQLAARGVKSQRLPMREIVAMAEAYILAHREIIADARAEVERWEAEGFFGPRRRSVRKGPELRTLTEQQAH